MLALATCKLKADDRGGPLLQAYSSKRVFLLSAAPPQCAATQATFFCYYFLSFPFVEEKEKKCDAA